ncbi:MAG: polysaccharide biosynthesis protein [Clostridia bacterium]|nr:polysaccharide biosynthesis protein [Clostridia bacterium]
MAKQGLYKGTVILALAGFFTKLIGALYRIPLARLLGAEGMGLYQMAYPLYTMLLALSAAGMPVAVSILVADKLSRHDRFGANRVLKASFFIMALVGAVFSFAVYWGAGFAANSILHEPRAYYAIVAIAPAVFFASLSAVFRGYFQGFQEMGPTALSQIVEQLVRVATVLLLVYYLLPFGLEIAAAGAAFGAVTGGIASLLLLIIVFKRVRKREMVNYRAKTPGEGIFSVGPRLASIALPLSLGGIVLPLMQVVDASIVPLRLQAAGYSPSQATEQFGQLAGMAATLINLPAIITVALATSLVPAVYEAFASRNNYLVRSRIRTALRATVLLMLPASVGLWALATPISVLLYDLAEVGRPLKWLAPGILFFGLYQVCAGALQGLGKTYLPAVHLLVGVVVKSYLSYWLVTWPFLGINGAALATVIGFIVAFVLNYKALKRLTNSGFSWRSIPLLKPGIASGLMLIIVYLSYGCLEPVLGNNISTLFTVVIGACAYGIALLIVGAVEANDLEHLPGGPFKTGTVNVLKKFRLLK